jgi:hypothetical protein
LVGALRTYINVAFMDEKSFIQFCVKPLFKEERRLACPGGVSFRQALHDEPEMLDRNCRVLK